MRTDAEYLVGAEISRSRVGEMYLVILVKIHACILLLFRSLSVFSLKHLYRDNSMQFNSIK